MTSIERSTTIRATPEAIWAVLADLGGIARWAPDVDHSWVLDAPGAGASRRIQTGRLTVIERVITWDPPQTLAYTVEGLPSVVRRVVNEWRLSPPAAGDDRGPSTVVTITTSVDAGPRPPQRLIARMVARRLGAVSDRMLAGLAEHLATPGGTT